jgi:hypothetical protein
MGARKEAENDPALGEKPRYTHGKDAICISPFDKLRVRRPCRSSC